MNYYQIKSSLSQITEEKMDRYLRSLSAELGEDLAKVSLSEYLTDDFPLLYVASGGSEGFFLEIYEELQARPCYILTSGDSNSLAASMEILSFLRQRGGTGEILHGSIPRIAARLKALRNTYRAKAALQGKTIGCIGQPSGWLIASTFSEEALMKKLGLGFVSIPMEELIREIEKNSYPENPYTSAFLSDSFRTEEIQKALYVYGALKRLTEKYQLVGLTVRCFDLLDTVRTTGCLALSILNNEGIYAGCEGDVPSLLSMALLGTVTGEPLFLCNPSRFDTDTGTAVFAHCTVPTTMLKNYTLNTHFESNIGVAVQGTFEPGDCTVFKCSGDLSRFHVQEGTILDMPFSPDLCRTQIRIALDDFRYFLTEPINNHHIICRGRHAREMTDFFSIL